MFLVYTVLPHHGGTVSVDKKTKTFRVIVPEGAKGVCFGDIGKIMGPVEPIDGNTFPIP